MKTSDSWCWSNGLPVNARSNSGYIRPEFDPRKFWDNYFYELLIVEFATQPNELENASPTLLFSVLEFLMLKYSFKKYQPLGLRLWHWLNAAVITGLLATVLLRKTLLSWRANSALIQEKLNAAGTTITPELAKEIAVAIRDPLWTLHVYLGFALAALLIGRFLVSVFVEKKGVNFKIFTDPFRMKGLQPAEKRKVLHFNFVKIGYVAFYAVTLLMVVTGLMLNFRTDLNLSKDLAGTTKEIHEFMMWFFVLFIGGHVIGVVIAENKNDRGLVSDMIHGGDPEKK